MIQIKKKGKKVIVIDDGKVINDVNKHFEAKVASRVNKAIIALKTLKINISTLN